MLSIAICCYQRAADLAVLLENLSTLALTKVRIDEVLVINNGSSTAISEVIRNIQPKLPLREVLENKLGLANARNRAIAESNSDLIWFLDDDTLVFEYTLEGYAKAIEAYPECDYFGGPIHVDWQSKKPSWLKSDDLVLLNGLFGVYQPYEHDFVYQSESLGPFGANFILNRRLINSVGLFNPMLGVLGRSIARGEEHEYIARARTEGFEGRYIAAAGVGHRFQLDRINLGYLWRYGLEKGREEVVIHQRRSDHWKSVASKQLLRGLWQALRGRRDRLYQCWINMGIARGRYLASKSHEGIKS